MAASVVVGTVWLLAVVAAGVVLSLRARPARPDSRTNAVWRRTVVASDESVVQLGKPVITAIVVAAGTAVTIAVCWVVGVWAGRLESAVDRPVFRWFQARQVDDWSDVWKVLTNVGGLMEIRVLVVAGAVVFGYVWWRIGRSWWVPVVILVVGYLIQYFGQEILSDVVHRGHPPTTLGTFPSGGCARTVLTYGLFVLFGFRACRVSSRRVWVAGWSFVALVAAVEAYARTYNLEHWITDAVGGLVFGVLLLLTMAAGFAVLDRTSPGRAGSDAVGERVETVEEPGAA